MNKTLQVILALVLAAVLVNDVSRLGAAHYALRQTAIHAAEQAALIAVQNEEDPMPGYRAAMDVAASEEATLTGYAQENKRVHVWVDGPIEGTVLLGPIMSLWSGGSWTEEPMIRKDFETAY
ncbi:MAG: hypothetical protein Kow0056_10800 [Coriobacteriia bacterium]